ncbi:MAG: PAS domain-containing protein, partial [Alkalimonas sp.]|nr:PAS domain-containing protein [Alkalimonas sp.]
EQKQAEQQLQEQKWLFEQILEQTMAGYWDWYIQENTEYLSPSFKQMFGYSDDEMENSPEAWQKIVFQEDLPKILASFEQHIASKGEVPFDNVVRYHHKNGSVVWVRCVGKVIEWSAKNQPVRMVGCHMDLTLEMEVRQALRESRDQFQTLVANIPGITYRCLADQHWTMVYMSGSIDPLSGYPASDFIQNKVRSYASVIHPEDSPRLEEEIAKAVAAKNSWLLQYRVLHKDGSVRYVEERGIGEYNEDGSLRYLDGFILDITNEKKLKRQLLKLTEQLPGVVYQFQQWPDGRISFPFASANLQKIYGVSPEDAKTDASQVFQCILPEDLPALTDSIERSKVELSLWQHEYRVVNQQGDVIWLSGRAMPEAMPDGSVLWHGYIYDITETKQHYLAMEQANEQLHLAQQRLELSSQQAQIGYWQASLKTGALWWSPMIYDVFGFDAASTEPSVALFKSTVHPDDLPLVEASEEKAKFTGLHDVVHRIIRPDGEIRWVHELAQMLPVSDNPELIMIGSVQDVTERMRLQQMKDEFISTVSHELRTPLTSINGALKLLLATQSDTMSDKGQKLLQVASSNSSRLQHLINDLLDIEKLIAGKMNFELKTQPILPLLQQAISDHSTFIEKAGLQLQLNITPPADQAKVVLDEYRLQQILANLLSNAMKYSPQQGVVTVQARLAGSELEIAIQDQGPGIPLTFHDHLFERFSQADASSAKEKGGTGLGLALCKELVEGMGGRISLDTGYQQGARFCIWFSLVS